MSDWHVETGDSLALMPGMPDGSVDAIVTSPPYADQRNYDAEELARSCGRTSRVLRARSRRQRSEAPALFPGWLEPFMDEMLRVVSPRGSLMLNLGVVLRDGQEHDCVDEILRRARGSGWQLLHRLVWAKPNGQVPSSPIFLTVAHEFVFWLAPDARAAYRGIDEARRPHAPETVRRLKRRRRESLNPPLHVAAKMGKTFRAHPLGARPTTVFDYAVGAEPNPNGHPARMALGLAEDLVKLSCPPGGLVLDPFAGDGTTGVACRALGRRFLGFEERADYAEGARRRIAEDPLEPTIAPGQLSLEGAIPAPAGGPDAGTGAAA